jgi:gamma-glutamyl-gamma-aminobutyrate hydrolase PuuD
MLPAKLPEKLPLQERKLKFSIIDGDPVIARYFREVLNMECVSDARSANVIVFPGGGDIHPQRYGDIVHPNARGIDVKRDQRWASMYGHFRSANILKVGVCRGGQFLNIMNEGKMWQHATNHLGYHDLVYQAKNGERLVFNVTSTHHQMMRPSMSGELWAWARLAKFRDTGTTVGAKAVWEEGPDPEVVYYPYTSCLCFQPHPEYESAQETRVLFEKVLTRAHDYQQHLHRVM